MSNAVEVAHFVSHLPFPKFHRPTDYMSMHDAKEYAYYDGAVISTTGLRLTPAQFMNKVVEIHSDDDFVKRTEFKGKAYFVGALARINNNHRQLNPIAKQAFKHIRLKLPITNSFYNVYCQAIEMIHFIEEAQKLLRRYLEIKHTKPMERYRIRAGKGVGAIEAPRGLLLHFYEVDKLGVLKNVNIITPTAQFINNLEDDLRLYMGGMQTMSAANQRKLGMMIRAYDPCMTCATH